MGLDLVLKTQGNIFKQMLKVITKYLSIIWTCSEWPEWRTVFPSVEAEICFLSSLYSQNECMPV